ncbi:MAG: hypothetical protein R2724_18320 [Bryobacterales bacterium]
MKHSIRCGAAAVVFAVSLSAVPNQPGGEVELLPIEGVREFPEATEPGAIRYACAPNTAALESFFGEKGLPFVAKLVRRVQDRKACHIFYEPTVPGFRALPDDRPIEGFVSGINPDDFVADLEPVGDSLSVVQAVLARVERPLDVMLSVVEEYGDAEWPAALERHFPNTPHHIRLLHSSASETHPWGQDFLKAGAVGGQLRLLSPRRLFEGRETDGERFAPMLDAFRDGPYARSKLSWEGGDLQVARDPRDPNKTILCYGSTVRRYWGGELRPAEFGWVMQVELGTDSVIDVSNIGPHTDYLVGFLPEPGVAVVSEPVRDDMQLMRSIVAALQQLYGDRAPRELSTLPGVITRLETGASEDAVRDIRRSVDILRVQLPTILPYVDPDTDRLVLDYLRANCPEDIQQCFTSPAAASCSPRIAIFAPRARREGPLRAGTDSPLAVARSARGPVPRRAVPDRRPAQPLGADPQGARFSGGPAAVSLWRPQDAAVAGR